MVKMPMERHVAATSRARSGRHKDAAEALPAIVPVSEQAVLVRFGASPSRALIARIRAAVAALEAARPGWLVDLVPAYTTLLVVFHPGTASPTTVRRALERALSRPDGGAPAARTVRVPVWYDPEVGLDLEEVARLHAMSVAEVVACHTAREYLVFALGFKPGFPYMGFLDDRLVTPRRPTPRLSVAAGSVAVAGRQTGIYPVTSPGGWRILGRTPLAVFDPARREPFLFQPGDRVRFEAIDRDAFDTLASTRGRET